MDARQELTERIQALADDLDTPSYEPPPLSIEDIQTRLEDILEDANDELERRKK